MSELSTAIGNIYNRLADSTSTPTFHPASADLFTDWNVQAGDVVTVKSDSESYQVPVYSMKMRWSGAPRVLVESTGNPEREPLPAIKRREYSANSTNYKEQKALKSGVAGINNTMQNAGLYVNDQGVWAFANDPTNGLGAKFSLQAGQIETVVTQTGIDDLGQGETLVSRVSAVRQTADSITLEIMEARGGESTLAGNINLRARTTTVEGLETNINSALTTISSLRAGSSTFSLVNTQAIRLAGRSLYLGPNNTVKYGAGD